jgi:hypothetical protein
MSPYVSASDFSYSAAVYSKDGGEGIAASGIADYLKNQIISEFSVGVVDPTDMIRNQITATFDFIVRVVLARSESKMGNFATWRIVAGMENTQSFGDRPIVHDPHFPMGKSRPGRCLYSSISLVSSMSPPFSTSGGSRFSDTIGKSFGNSAANPTIGENFESHNSSKRSGKHIL